VVSKAPCSFVRAWAVIDPDALSTSSDLTQGVDGKFNVSGVRRMPSGNFKDTIQVGFSEDFKDANNALLTITNMCVIVQPYHDTTPATIGNFSNQASWSAKVVGGNGAEIYIGIFNSSGTLIPPQSVGAAFGIRVMVTV